MAGIDERVLGQTIFPTIKKGDAVGPNDWEPWARGPKVGEGLMPVGTRAKMCRKTRVFLSP